MSESGMQGRSLQLSLRDMVGFCRRILTFSAGLSKEEFIRADERYDAALFNLQRLGIAATRIPDQVKEAHPDIQWRRMIALRNRLAHDYLSVDEDVIWEIIKNDVPALMERLQGLLGEFAS